MVQAAPAQTAFGDPVAQAAPVAQKTAFGDSAVQAPEETNQELKDRVGEIRAPSEFEKLSALTHGFFDSPVHIAPPTPGVVESAPQAANRVVKEAPGCWVIGAQAGNLLGLATGAGLDKVPPRGCSQAAYSTAFHRVLNRAVPDVLWTS